MGIQETIFKKDANKIKELNVVSIIDITGSMSGQLEGIVPYNELNAIMYFQNFDLRKKIFKKKYIGQILLD